MTRRPGPVAWGALATLAVELVALGRRRPDLTLCPDIRSAFATHTPAGKVAFSCAWLAFSAWFVPHILSGPEER